jgi:hypothetical protein
MTRRFSDVLRPPLPVGARRKEQAMSNRDMSETTMELLGKLIPEGAGRDAIHIAVAPVVAVERLAPGQHIGLLDDGKAGSSVTPIGIVDPYLPSPVYPGDRFFLWLYPRTITSLRHEWTHPAFSRTPTTISDSEAWLRTFAGRWHMHYDSMIQSAIEGESICGSTENYDMEPAEKAEFWVRAEIVTGRKFSEDHRETTYFRCSC